MRVFLALVIGIVIGALGLWFFNTQQGRSSAEAVGKQIQTAAGSARDTVQEKLRVLSISTNDIRQDLARTGRVVRKSAQEAGQAIADATADTRTTAAIKTKLLGSRELSALSISVNTTAGVVTLSGAVNSTEEISKAMLIALETEGVREVISTLQVKPRNGKT